MKAASSIVYGGNEKANGLFLIENFMDNLKIFYFFWHISA